MHSLRTRLILSHTLPVLIIAPLTVLTLIYVLETRFLLPTFTGQLIVEAQMISKIAKDHPEVWQDQAAAQRFVAHIQHDDSTLIMLLSLTGRLLATNDEQMRSRVGQPVVHPGLAQVNSGQIYVNTNDSQNKSDEIVDILSPVFNVKQQVMGAIRLSHPLANVYRYILSLRTYILIVSIARLLIHLIVGVLLALSLERPLRNLTQAIFQLGQGGAPLLPEPRIVEFRQLVRSFNHLTERLRISERTRQQLLANLVHEIRRPLGALSSAVHALQHGASEDAALRTELLTGIAAELQRLARQTENLALLSAQTVGKLNLEPRLTDLGDWLASVLPTWREAAQQKGIDWQVQLPAAPAIVFMDPDRLAQALGNLLSNAVKFTPAGGLITLQVELGANSLQICIRDTGPGIPPQEQMHIFEPFYRGPAHQRSSQGMGLGLTIARELVIAHGGQLTVESTPGAGSCFILTIPLPTKPD